MTELMKTNVYIYRTIYTIEGNINN